jgi:iron complex transport system substrate-binding protein
MANPAQAAAEVKVVVDGKALSMDVKPVIENDRTLVPLRAIFEALGAKVDWDGKTRTVTAVKGSTSIRLVVGNATALKNGSKVKLDVPAKIRNGRTLVPLRFVSEALGADVDWDAATYTVAIKNKQEFITITDSKGRQVKVPSSPKRIVVTNSDVAEVISALGAADRIVGASDTCMEDPMLSQKLKNAVSVGKWSRPSVEKIVELKPDVVFAYAGFLKNAGQVEAAGIPLVCLDCYKIETLAKDIKTLGQILNKEKEAAEYVNCMEKYLNIIESRVKSLKTNQKPLVYLESYSDYKSVSVGSGGHQMLVMAGGTNIAGGEPVAFPQVSPEWVLSKNPQVIIKAVSSKVASGYGETGEAMKKKREEIMSRPGWKGISAVKNGRVYIISSDVYTGPRAVVGIAYFAKWLHPQLFADLDPAAIHNEILTRFHGLKPEGAWVYPAGE